MGALEVRYERPGDEAPLRQILTAAFGQEAEANLVEALRGTNGLALSLVATSDGAPIGHVALSPVQVAGKAGDGRWLGLGPLAVLAEHRRRGVGHRLVQQALQIAGDNGASAMFVLGDPHYYRRFGFAPAPSLGWQCSYDVPEPVFQVRTLGDPLLLPSPGMVLYHPAFGAL